MIIATNGAEDSDASSSDYLCPDLLPEHMSEMTSSRSLDKIACPYWHIRDYAELPVGFWNLLYMDMRGKASSGYPSASLHTVFLLSAKIHVAQTQKEGTTKIAVHASTQVAFRAALTALHQVQKFYPGMALWEVSRAEISAKEWRAIIDPAQVLIMTAAGFLQKKENVIRDFDDAYAKHAYQFKHCKNFIQRAQSDASLDEEAKNLLETFSKTFDETASSIESLRCRLHDAHGDHSTTSMKLSAISADYDKLVEATLRPQYGSCVRAAVRPALGEAPLESRGTNRIVPVDGADSRLVWDHSWFDKKLGFRWERIGKTQPTHGKLLTSPVLESFLECKHCQKKEFGEAELNAFGMGDLQPDDQVIPKGQQIALMIFSSDRDFTLWPDPGTQLTVDLDATSITLPVVGGCEALGKALSSEE